MTRHILKDADLEITHVRGSGPGGQNRNKRWTGVRIVHLPTGLVSMATERRSQGQNLQAAMERLEEKLQAYYYKPKPRKATAPTRSSERRRSEAKNKRSALKKQRRDGPRDYD